jgi:iron complex outermembrane recepter protein
LTLQSPFNPFADANGNIFVVPGDHLTGIPNFRFKLGAEYQVTKPWKVGADLNVVGAQYLVHDDTNQSPMVPGYHVLNLHTSYQITPNIEVFGLINNVLNERYYVQGTFFETGGFQSANSNVNNLQASLTDPRTFLPGMPLAAYAGLKVKF